MTDAARGRHMLHLPLNNTLQLHHDWNKKSELMLMRRATAENARFEGIPEFEAPTVRRTPLIFFFWGGVKTRC